MLHRRCPILNIIIVPVQVQGDGSAEQIALAIRSLNKLGFVDVIIVGRGGGASEDLWSFNEEAVVRAIVASAIPVVSAVGHETDVTLADFAADMRAPTPSAAAEAVAPVLAEVVRDLGELTIRCQQAMSRRCGVERQRLDLALARAGNIRLRVGEEAQRVDIAVIQLREAVRGMLKQGWEKAHSFRHELAVRSPAARVRHGLAMVSQLRSRLESVMRYNLDQQYQKVRSHLLGLNNLSPLAILDRGYSIVESVPARRVIRDATEVSTGQEVLARLAKGQLQCTVEKVITDPPV